MNVTTKELLSMFLIMFGAGLFYSGINAYVPDVINSQMSVLIGAGFIIGVFALKYADQE